MIFAILRLMESCQPEPIDHSLLTDDELEEECDRYLVNMIRKTPAIAVVAAFQLGWQVIPPTPSATATGPP